MVDREKGRLDSWKAIADYIGRDVRTAIRWEHERGLPVHRVPGGKRGAVFAFAGEIDKWLLRSGGPPNVVAHPAEPGPSTAAPRSSWTRSRWIGALAVALALALLGLAVQASIASRQHDRAPVVSVSLAGTGLVARGPERQVLWRHDFGRTVVTREDPATGRPRATFADTGDLDGDGFPDLVVTVAFGRDDAFPSQTRHELFAFSTSGQVLWSRQAAATVTFGGGTYGPPWQSPFGGESGRQVAVFSVGGAPRIAWATAHHTWWPSLLTVFDAAGRQLSTWVHSGVIFDVVPMDTSAGPRLLAGGISNSREAAFLAVLDAARVEGTGPEEAGSPFECRSCGPGGPLRYFVIQPSEQRLAVPSPYNVLNTLLPDEDGVEVRTAEFTRDEQMKVQAVARLSRDLALEHIAWSSAWAAGHRALERAGKLDHPVERCAERDRPPRVREWTPARGWRDVTPGALVASARGGTASVRQ